MASTPASNPRPAPVQVGLLGYGWWGKTIARQLAASPWLQLAAVAEVDAGARAAMATDPVLAGVAVHAGAEALLAQPGLEAVVLCTPHQQHAAQIVAAAEAGLHVFCEKPLCLTLADAERAVAACQARGRVLGIGHERRFEPEVVALWQLIAAGTLGTVLQIEANFSQDKFFALPRDNWRLSNAHAPVGPLTATGIHLVDLAIAVLGPCETVWARLATLGSGFENGDTLAVMMAFPNGANALVSAILATPFEGRFAVYGSQGWVEIRDRTHPEQPTGWDITIALRGQPVQRHFAEPAPSVRHNLEAFAQAIRGVQPYPVTAAEMLANVAALEAIMQSVQQRAPVAVAAARG
ncbi:Gfo/Idh/MocA family protein [Rubrivivax sp. RP6-9]|uniref:Gfo/Idh/MocA family protein n=1 Tax=Rubrivivax sp. RP6-9 TaxID=3415750 RepID=UPI003CC5EC03